MQQAAFLETIRDVLDKSPYSGASMPPPLRADFDNNLVVDDDDLQLLQQSINKEKLSDSDNDGDVDGRDFLTWQRHYTPDLVDPNFLLADLNKDDVFNADDLPVWLNAYGNSASADLDGDGDSDGHDLLIWQRAAPSDPADVNADFLVDGLDLALWQESVGFNLSADANDDGKVNNVDLEILQSEFGRTWTYPAALSAPPLASQAGELAGLNVIPEPTTTVLALCGMIALCGGRVRG